MHWTLLGDGRGDRALMPLLSWLLEQRSPRAFLGAWAEPAYLPPVRGGLALRMRAAVQLYPCDLLFVHRDAERQSREVRVQEIRSGKATFSHCPPTACVIPVRMTEAWLLFDEPALRTAAGNPNGRVDLRLPRLQDADSLPDPKRLLEDCLKRATGRQARRLPGFAIGAAVQRLAE